MSDSPQYGTAEYWEDRYARSTALFEWYEAYEPLRPLFERYLPRDEPVLQIGVGTSEIQLDMVKDGYISITSQDLSSTCVRHLQQLHSDQRELKYITGDCRCMPDIADSSYGSILDKGTLDSIMCGDNGASEGARALRECSRVLRPGLHRAIKVELDQAMSVGGEAGHFIYACTKNQPAADQEGGSNADKQASWKAPDLSKLAEIPHDQQYHQQRLHSSDESRKRRDNKRSRPNLLPLPRRS
ncbi:hypothetical protein WJX73_006433 [Symbiochloris irregularis]|uniref:Methyltransferase type 11 domain-containing protein n=1 Tax=Symbiochloris irregularis TaxID=706552 RepID=A0AAW1NXS3_9CHLO